MSSYDPRLIAFTGAHEGRVLKAYKDPTGTITIGYGFTWGSGNFREYWLQTRGHKLRMGDRITPDECTALLKSLIDKEYAPKPLRMFANRSPHAKAAGVDMPYNAGPGSLKWKWAIDLAAGKVTSAANRYRNTATTSRGRKLPGLVRRRREMALIMEKNVWPTWLKEAPPAPKGKTPKPPAEPWRLTPEDLMEAQRLLNAQGYGPLKVDGIVGKATRSATAAFQRKHPQLDNDGIMGRATYSALQRVRNMKQESVVTVGAGGAPTAVGGADATPIADWLLWGGVAALVVVGGYLIWTYRDEIKLGLRKL